MGIEAWSITPASNNAAPPAGAPEGMAPSTVNNVIRQQMADHRAQWNDAQWFEYGDGDGAATVTYVAATQFKVEGVDVSTAYHVGRRVKIVASTPGTIYGTISAVTFSTDTTVTVAFDSGSLSNEALTVSLGIMTPTNRAAVPVHGGITSVSSSPYTMLLSDRGRLVDVDATSAAVTINLPAATTAGDGFFVTVKKTDASANAVTVDGNAAETIDGAATHVISNQYEAVNFVCDGTQWLVAAVSSSSPIDGLSVTDGNFIVGDGGGWVAESGTTARTSLGLGALATLSSVAAAQIDADAVAQSELKTTNGDVNQTSATTAHFTMPGGAFGFYPRHKGSTAAGGNTSYPIHPTPAVTTGLLSTIAMAESGAVTLTANQEYIQASPPYDLGDGEVPLFVFLVVATDGSVLTAYVAPDPPWANNGPTNIRPDFVDQNGRGQQYRPKGFVNHVPINTLVGNRALREQFIAARNAIDRNNPNTFDLKEITNAVKNADMALIPFHHQGIPNEGAGDFVGATAVILDPVSALLEELLVLHEENDPDFSIGELIIDGLIEFGNSAIPGRKGPPGVMPVSVNWKA